MYKLGVDIGGTKINIGIFSSKNELLCSKKIKIKDIKNEEFFKSVAEEIKNYLHDENYDINNFEFCGVGVPGTVDSTGRVAVKLPNLNVYNANAADILEKELHIPVRLVQDSRAGAWAEYCAGGGQGCKNVICLTLGTGIGLGIVLDGNIFDGATGTAGEISHNCVVADGRPCNCGKSGCLGMYSAGLGLEETSKELFGEGATSEDLFAAAENGNVEAKDKINEAVIYLGKEIVSLYNNFAPDCILFSGGISKQYSLYVEPLIEYIKNNIYTTEGGRMPDIKLAELGENAPMIGAALLPHEIRRKDKYSASIMCADIMNLGHDFKELEEAGVGLFHMDIMDGHFVPNLMIPMEYINRMRKHTDAIFDVHIMAENPEKIVDALELNEGDIVSVHSESTNHLQRVLAQIKAKGLVAAVAINPATPFECIKEVLCDVDMILIMTVNPGYSGQKLVKQSIDKIRRIREYLDNNGYSDIEIEVDGNCSFENIPLMRNAGANVFVLGTSGLYRSDMSMKEAIKKISKF